MMDPGAMRALLDGRRAGVRDEARARLADPRFAPVDEVPRAEYRELVLAWARELADGGSPALGFPPEYGGGGDVGGMISSFEMLGHGDLSLMVKCGVQFGLFGGAILHLGTRRHHDAYLRDVLSLALPGAFAMTESGHGSNVQGLRTTATYDPVTQEFLIDTPDDAARKDYIGNAAVHGRMAVVFAQLVVGGQSRGVHALLAPLRDASGDVVDRVRIEDCGHKLGLNGVDNGRIWFDGLRVPRENLLDRYAQVTPEGAYESEIENPDKRFFTMVGTLIQGRVSVAGASGSAAKNALTIALRHAARRRQFGPDADHEVTLLTYATHRRRLIPKLADAYALHFAQRRMVEDLHSSFSDPDSPIDRRKLESTAAGMKALASWHARDTIQECREACGGLGYLAENRFAALKADTDIFTTFEGDNVVLLQLVGRALLTEYSHDFGELTQVGTAQFLAARVWDTVVERSGAREVVGRLADDLLPGRDEEDLLDRGTQHGLIKWRAEHHVQTLAQRLKSGMDDGEEAFAVFMHVQDHVVTAARAHMEHLVFDCFADAVRDAPEGAARDVLGRLCDLHALAMLERDRGYYQEHGRMSSTKAKDVQRLVTQLCQELVDDAVALTDAFAIPDQAIAAPIAMR